MATTTHQKSDSHHYTMAKGASTFLLTLQGNQQSMPAFQKIAWLPLTNRDQTSFPSPLHSHDPYITHQVTGTQKCFLPPNFRLPHVNEALTHVNVETLIVKMIGCIATSKSKHEIHAQTE